MPAPHLVLYLHLRFSVTQRVVGSIPRSDESLIPVSEPPSTSLSSFAVVYCPRPSSLSVSLFFYVLVSRSFLGSLMSYVLVFRLRSFSAISGLNFSKHNIEITNSIQAYCKADYAADRDRKSIPDNFSSLQAKLLVGTRRSKGLLNRGLKENTRP